MNIAIFGGTGSTGLLVIQKALSAGHNVIVFARAPSKISFKHNSLSIVEGKLNDIDKIEATVKMLMQLSVY